MYRQNAKHVHNAIFFALIACASCTASWLLFWPVKLSIESDKIAPTNENMSTQRGDTDHRIEVDQTWSRRLRNWQTASIDLQSPMKAEEYSQNQLRLWLVGTIIEKNNSYAMIADSVGNVDMQKIGGLLQIEPAGIRVERIDRQQVEVSYEGSREVLQVVKVPIDSVVDADPEMADSSSADPGLNPQMEDEYMPKFESLDSELDWLNGSPPQPMRENVEDKNAVSATDDRPTTGRE